MRTCARCVKNVRVNQNNVSAAFSPTFFFLQEIKIIRFAPSHQRNSINEIILEGGLALVSQLKGLMRSPHTGWQKCNCCYQKEKRAFDFHVGFHSKPPSLHTPWFILHSRDRSFVGNHLPRPVSCVVSFYFRVLFFPLCAAGYESALLRKKDGGYCANEADAECRRDFD